MRYCRLGRRHLVMKLETTTLDHSTCAAVSSPCVELALLSARRPSAWPWSICTDILYYYRVCTVLDPDHLCPHLHTHQEDNPLTLPNCSPLSHVPASFLYTIGESCAHVCLRPIMTAGHLAFIHGAILAYPHVHVHVHQPPTSHLAPGSFQLPESGHPRRYHHLCTIPGIAKYPAAEYENSVRH